MFKLAIILTFITLASSKLTQAPDFWFLEYFNVVEQPISNVIKKAPNLSERSKEFWVLNFDLDGLGPFRLTLGSKEQENEFDAVFGPMIDRFKSRQRAHTLKEVTKTKNPQDGKNNNTRIKLKIMKEEIRKIVNKFVLSFVEAGSHLPGADVEHSTNPSLALCFKGPFTSLVVEFGMKQWHYFIGPPSPFSAWFYREHTNIVQNGDDVYVDIPAVLKGEFYRALLSLLRNLLSFPV